MTLPKDPLKREEYIKHQREVQKKRFENNPEEHKRFSELAKNRPPISEETRKKLSIASSNMSLETRAKISLSLIGNTRTLGRKAPQEERDRLSAAQKKRFEDPKERQKMSDVTRGEKNPMFGKHHSLETREKISKSRMGKSLPPFTEEHKRKIGEAHKGRIVTEETREKLRIINTGKHPSEETKKKLSEANKGKVVSKETREKLSVAAKGRKHTEEAKEKMSKAQIKRYEDHPEQRKIRSELSKGRHPSEATRKKMSEQRKGENNSNYKDGKTPLYSKIRSCGRMKEWIQAVFKRDNYKDWFSGCTGTRKNPIEAHHIISFTYLLRKYKIKSVEEAELCEELWDVNNGVTILQKSHKAHHNMWGKDAKYNPE